MSARTHSILSPDGRPPGGSTGGSAPKTTRNKLRREERTGSVLPPPSQWSRGPITYGHATALGGVGHTGYQAAHSYGTLGGGAAGTTGYGSAASAYTTRGYAGTNTVRGGSYGGGTGQGATGGGRLQQKIEEAREKNKERRERHKTKRRPDEITKSNLVVDEQGVAHDSEYVQFRTATPIHVQKRQAAAAENPPRDDDSASSSSSSSADSGFESSPYTYQSTHRTASSSHHQSSRHHPSSTLSAVPSYLASHHRGSLDMSGSLSVPSAPSPRGPSSPSSLYGDSSYGAYDRMGPGYGSQTTTSKLRSASTPVQHTTASYQPPAPSYVPRTNPSSDGHSLAESTAQLSLGGSTVNGGTESGYTKAIKAGHAPSMRPPKMDGSALDAGVHGMKRSFDGFKLDVKFGAHKMGKKLSRKLNAI
ncbi:hypothetical protein JCM11641_007754 [Rhodosporidiobolus odoratus]